MPMVKILTEHCKSCAYCVRQCPKEVLEIGQEINARGYRVARPARPEDCIACKLCSVMCPDSAIEIYK